MKPVLMRRRARIGTLWLVMTGLFLMAAMRLVELVALDGPALSSLARSEHTGELRLAAARGPIVDRNGEPLALSAETRSVYARPKKLIESSTPAQRARLAKELGLSAAELQSRLSHRAPFVWLARHLAPERGEAAEALGARRYRRAQRIQAFLPGEQSGRRSGWAGWDGRSGALRG